MFDMKSVWWRHLTGSSAGYQAYRVTLLTAGVRNTLQTLSALNSDMRCQKPSTHMSCPSLQHSSDKSV
jgi:hypothetical protein